METTRCRQRLVAYLIEMPQINGEVARGQRCAYKPVPSASWADFYVELISTLDRIGHVARVAGVEDGGGMRLKIDHDISGFGGGGCGIYELRVKRFEFTKRAGNDNKVSTSLPIRTGDLGHKAVRPSFRQPREGQHKSPG